MNLYVVKAVWMYEGAEVIGVFDTQAAAQAVCDRHEGQHGPRQPDYCVVVECELNKDAWTPP